MQYGQQDTCPDLIQWSANVHIFISQHCTLLQVLTLLAEDRASAAPEVAEDRLGYSTIQLAIPAASAGAYLIDLLHMRSLKFSPMSATSPDDFLKACQGMLPCKTKLELAAHTCNIPSQGM